jgi:hypothetical protein
MTDPTKARCWDKDWRYVPKDATDVAKTFARIRRQMKEDQAVKKSANVKPIKLEKRA